MGLSSRQQQMIEKLEALDFDDARWKVKTKHWGSGGNQQTAETWLAEKEDKERRHDAINSRWLDRLFGFLSGIIVTLIGVIVAWLLNK